MASEHAESRKPWIGKAAAIAALAVIAFAASFDGRVDGPLDMYHEGERLAHIDTLLAGGLPYRDVYVPHGLGEDILKPLAARWIYGDSVASLRRLGQNNYIYRGLLPPLGAVCVVLAAGAITQSITAAGIAAALVALGLYEVSERHVFGLLSVASLAMYMHGRNVRWLWVAGLLASFAALYSLEVGLYAIVVGVAWLPLDTWIHTPGIGVWRTAPRRLLLFIAGVAVGLAPFIAWAAWHGILHHVWANISMQLFLRKELYPVTYPTVSWMADQPFLDNLKVAGGTLLIFYVTPFSYVAGMLLFRFTPSVDHMIRSRLVLGSLTGAMFWITVLGRADLWHVAFACAGFFVFVAMMATSLWQMRTRWIVWGPQAIVIATVMANLWIGQGGAISRVWLGGESAFLPPHLRSEGRPMRATGIPRLAGMKIPVDQADYLEMVVGYLQAKSSPKETILDLSDQGLLYYLAGRRCPTRFAFVNYCGTPELRAEMVAEITRNPLLPAYVIRYTSDVSTPDALGAFVDQHYYEETRIGPVVLLRRTDVRVSL